MTAEIRRPGDNEAGIVRKLWEACFPEDGTQYADWFFGTVYSRENTLCLFEDATLASALQMIPYDLSIRARRLHVNTLSGVSTDPAMRKRGHAKTLMAAALGDMAARGIGLTFLYPFDHDFYERLGWATCSSSLEYRMPAAELPSSPPEGFTVRKARHNTPALSAVYSRWSEGRNCFSLRGEKDWLKRIGENVACEGSILLAEYRGEPCAYAIAEVESGEINAYEMVSLTPSATQATLSALRPGGLPVRFTMPEDDRSYLLPGRWMNSARLQPHVMFRVTDVGLAFRQVKPEGSGEFAIEVTGDNMRPENNGTYRVKAESGEAHAERTDAKAQFSCGIGALARILTGYVDTKEAVGAGLAQGDHETIELLQKAYPKQRNFLFELY